ncbi:dihydropteroate synthase [Alcanivorax sp. HI0013]|nr:dihydropteroate synthase [Alcanivorax sp. HI0003]KZX71120.1 dihydropteroate synthase [Alcanivorax sp. HI0007]KZX75394.1 dihydropteroate synthase [Alcanivorax sp. HI0013]KZX76724.1 dihydropteroate synthase [Alcanivorax sp. HI0011]KZY13137.1 dihydropteroate synthase [Alcanivorax sp. HI0035]
MIETLTCGARTLDLSAPVVMGILNVTPDSFSDGGRFTERDAALRQAERMLADGAAIIDVGGESTRPGAAPVSEQQELDRVVPVVEALTSELDALVSVDTSTAAVIHGAAAAGAGMINDVRALRRSGALDAAAASGLPVCLMHMRGEPGNMQDDPRYQDVTAEVVDFLRQRIAACGQVGIPRERLLVDPGFGFAKTVAHNLTLMHEMAALQELALPILIGISRKSLFGKLLGRDVNERLPASLAAAVMCVERGAMIVRAHDVKETVDVVRLAHAVRQSSGGERTK